MTAIQSTELPYRACSPEWLQLVRVVALVTMVYGAFQFLQIALWASAFYVGGSSLQLQFLMGWRESVLLLANLCRGICGLLLVVVSFQCARFRQRSRGQVTLIVAVIWAMSLVPLVQAGLMMFSEVPRRSLHAYADLASFTITSLTMFSEALLPALVIWVLTRAETRALFHEG